MRATGDPRVDPNYNGWDEYKYYARQFDSTRTPPAKSPAATAK
jgi:hypothetical protein